MSDADQYTAEELALRQGSRIAKRLGIPTDEIEALELELFEDLNTTTFGFGWWVERVPSARRILISDYMVAAADSVPTNLIEAALHFRDAERDADATAERFRRHVRTGGDLSKIPLARSFEDELVNVRIDADVVAGFRALASALDCFAALVVGVGAYPLSLIRANWDELRRHLIAKAQRADNEDGGVLAQQELARALLNVVDESGPTNWLQWTLQYRNALVHRPRNITTHQVHIPGGRVVLPRQTALELLEVVQHLPRRPGAPQADAMRTDTIDGYLMTEDGRKTARAALASAARLTEAGSKLLLQFWRDRRADPARLEQPSRKQWPDLDVTAVAFDGFDPGSLPIAASQMAVHPSTWRRVEAAALTDADRDLWKQFLAEADVDAV